MAAADVRDMLDLPAEGQPRPHKKQKVAERRPGLWYMRSFDLLAGNKIKLTCCLYRRRSQRTIRASRRASTSDRHHRKSIQRPTKMDKQVKSPAMVYPTLSLLDQTTAQSADSSLSPGAWYLLPTVLDLTASSSAIGKEWRNLSKHRCLKERI